MANVAARYARGLFETGVAEGHDTELRYGELLEGFVKGIAEIADFKSLLYAPQVSRDKKKRVLSDIFSDPADAHFLAFLKLLVDKGRLEMVSLISLDYKGLVLASRNVLEALIESAFPLDDKTVAFTYKDYRHGNEQKVMRLHQRNVDAMRQKHSLTTAKLPS